MSLSGWFIVISGVLQKLQCFIFNNYGSFQILAVLHFQKQFLILYSPISRCIVFPTVWLVLSGWSVNVHYDFVAIGALYSHAWFYRYCYSVWFHLDGCITMITCAFYLPTLLALVSYWDFTTVCRSKDVNIVIHTPLNISQYANETLS